MIHNFWLCIDSTTRSDSFKQSHSSTSTTTAHARVSVQLDMKIHANKLSGVTVFQKHNILHASLVFKNTTYHK